MTESRWATGTRAGHSARYVERMRAAARGGDDLDGEARFVDALLPRGARVLDAGCGTGRTGAALHARGHQVVGVDADEVLIAAAREDHPGPEWLVGDLARLDRLDGMTGFDAVVLAGNVLVFLAPGSERAVLEQLTAALRPGGVLVAGFATDREYRVPDLDADADAAGLVLEHRFATWDLHPWHADADWAVTVLRRPG